VVRLALFAAALCLAACVDTKTCHMPSQWKPCAGQSAQPGASGAPPSIVELSIPTCAYKDAPIVSGTARISDPDGDAQVLKATSFQGMRNAESELELDDVRRSGNDWAGDFAVAVAGMDTMLMEGDIDVVMKVADRAGAQSVPYCNTVSIVR
jgi:hypothetical protein